MTKPRKEVTSTTRRAWIFSAVLQHPSRYTKLCLPALHVGVWWGYDIPTTRSLTMFLARLLSRHGKGLVPPITGTCSPLTTASRKAVTRSRRSRTRVPCGGTIPQIRTLFPPLIKSSVNEDKRRERVCDRYTVVEVHISGKTPNTSELNLELRSNTASTPATHRINKLKDQRGLIQVQTMSIRIPIRRLCTQSNALPRLCIHSSRLNLRYLKPFIATSIGGPF